MSAPVLRWVLLVLAALAAYVGVWAVSVPRSFFDLFPGAGHHWLIVDGPYNEHLVRDVGGLYLALLTFSVGAALSLTPSLVRLTGAAWLAFSVPHLSYHVAHLDMYGGVDRLLNIVTLGGTVVLAAALLLPHRREVAAADVT